MAALAFVGALAPLSATGWVAGLSYLVVSTLLVARGLGRQRPARFGPANTATAARSVLIGVVTALVATSLTQPVPPWVVVTIASPALALDAVDGWLARRTGTETALGARFDMEVDAFALLALSVFVAGTLGWWVVAIGLMRYAFVAAGWAMPWLKARLPARYWRKVVTAVCGITLVLAATGAAPSALAGGAVALALALLVESFGRDVVWLARAHLSAREGLTEESAEAALKWWI
ncbi:CDP-alcohol phosphatidyltransferase family protein [Gryllotalpicola reticulitermitis]|uniref:CDP-alcohol phosphatidyltransferase family protein n=1 Tax=Gryllotalpicola reticulitermitis TaxID=1184153 RepID=A0ABV8Q9K9_9MICO